MKINIWKKSNIDMNGLVCGEKISRRQDSREPPHARNFREVCESLVVAKFSHRESVCSCQCYFFPDINLLQKLVYSI